MAMRWSVRIKPEITADRRFAKLLKQSGTDWEAIGKLYYFWSMACGYYVLGQSIPIDKFESLGTPELIELGFAEKVDGGIRAKGDLEHFKWAVAAVKNGKKGGQKRVENRAAAIANQQPNNRQPIGDLQATLEQEQEQEQEQEPSIGDKSPHPTKAGDKEGDQLNDRSQDEEKAAKKAEQRKAAKPVLECWNEESGTLAKVKTDSISPKRLGAINARLKEAPLEKWREVFRAIAAWPWGLGDNPSGWQATFDFAMQAGTLDKFDCGAFKARPQQRKSSGRVDARTVSQCLPESEPVFNVLED